MLSSFHVYTFREVVGSMSLTALGSASLFVLGLVLLPLRSIFARAPLAVYAVIFAIALSALANGSVISAFEPITKYGLFLMIAVHCFRALQAGEERRFGFALLLSFAPLLVFQCLSVLLAAPKSTEGSGGESYIGGYYHEAAFSIGVVALLIVGALQRSLPPLLKLLIIPVCLASILLANYRTAILASGPLLVYYILYAVTRPIEPRLRGVMSALGGIAIIATVMLGVLTLDRFKDLQTVTEDGTALIKPPNEITSDDRQLLSGRTQIWSEYIYKWRDGNELQHLVGYGPDSWEDYFEVYAHNSFISYLFEYGLFGLAALLALFCSGLFMAAMAVRERWKLLAAHLSFVVLNLATMPLWLIEGNVAYGLLWGYTLYYRWERKAVFVRLDQRPALARVAA
jgi:hypothetical protein